MSDFEIGTNGIKIPENTVKTIYNDIAHPVLLEAGKTMAIPFKAINWLAEVAKAYCVDKMANTEKLKNCVQKRIESIPDEELREPPKNIVVPAILSNSYTDSEELRLMYANLIANSMNKQQKHSAHPAFVEIIKQLTPSEALLLKSSNILTHTTPICQIRYQKKSSFNNLPHHNLASNHIIREFNEGVTALKYYIPSLKHIPVQDLQIMMDNFIRLNLVEVLTGKISINKDSYIDFYKDEFNIELEHSYASQNEDQWKDYELAHVLYVMAPTDFGRSFYKVCVE